MGNAFSEDADDAYVLGKGGLTEGSTVFDGSTTGWETADEVTIESRDDSLGRGSTRKNPGNSKGLFNNIKRGSDSSRSTGGWETFDETAGTFDDTAGGTFDENLGGSFDKKVVKPLPKSTVRIRSERRTLIALSDSNELTARTDMAHESVLHSSSEGDGDVDTDQSSDKYAVVSKRSGNFSRLSGHQSPVSDAIRPRSHGLRSPKNALSKERSSHQPPTEDPAATSKPTGHISKHRGQSSPKYNVIETDSSNEDMNNVAESQRRISWPQPVAKPSSPKDNFLQMVDNVWEVLDVRDIDDDSRESTESTQRENHSKIPKRRDRGRVEPRREVPKGRDRGRVEPRHETLSNRHAGRVEPRRETQSDQEHGQVEPFREIGTCVEQYPEAHNINRVLAEMDPGVEVDTTGQQLDEESFETAVESEQKTDAAMAETPRAVIPQPALDLFDVKGIEDQGMKRILSVFAQELAKALSHNGKGTSLLTQLLDNTPGSPIAAELSRAIDATQDGALETPPLETPKREEENIPQESTPKSSKSLVEGPKKQGIESTSEEKNDDKNIRGILSLTSEDLEEVDMEFVKQYGELFEDFLSAHPELAKENPSMIEFLRVAKLQDLLERTEEVECELSQILPSLQNQKKVMIRNYQRELLEAAKDKATRGVQLEQDLGKAHQTTKMLKGTMNWDYVMKHKDRVDNQIELLQKLWMSEVDPRDPVATLPNTVETLDVRNATNFVPTGCSDDKEKLIRQTQVDNAFLTAEISVLETKLAYLKDNAKDNLWVDPLFRRMDLRALNKLKVQYQKSLGLSF